MEDKKEQEEYKKRIQDLVGLLENENLNPLDIKLLDYTEIIKINLLDTIEYKKRTGNRFASKFVIESLILNIEVYFEYKEKCKAMLEERKYKNELDYAFQLLYEELKKPFQFYSRIPKNFEYNQDPFKYFFNFMKQKWGEDKFNFFFKKYDIKKLIFSPNKIVFFIILFAFIIVIFCSSIFLLLF